MSLDGNIGIITSEVALFPKNAHMSLEENIGGYTSEASSGQMPITSETPSSVEGSSGCNISEATSGQNAHDIRDAIERGREQRRKTSRGFFWAYAYMRLSEGTSIQQVLETSANPEFGLMSMPEWARSRWSYAHQATSVSYLRSVEESGQKMRVSDSWSYEERDGSISSQV